MGMNYQSPIDLLQTQIEGMDYQSPIELMQTQMEGQLVDTIYEAVLKVGVNVDKEELLKALAYDRDQYQKGYADREREIIRCRDCKFGEECVPSCEDRYCIFYDQRHNEDWYCADGERRDMDDFVECFKKRIEEAKTIIKKWASMFEQKGRDDDV